MPSEIAARLQADVVAYEGPARGNWLTGGDAARAGRALARPDGLRFFHLDRLAARIVQHEPRRAGAAADEPLTVRSLNGGARTPRPCATRPRRPRRRAGGTAGRS